MQVTGMLYGSKLLQFVGFPTSEILGPDASEEEIKALIDRHGSVFVKPVFKGGVGKKGKAGLLGRAKDLKTALKEKERLYFVEHRHGNQFAKANGVTFEGAVPAEHEVYFSISDSVVKKVSHRLINSFSRASIYLSFAVSSFSTCSSLGTPCTLAR